MMWDTHNAEVGIFDRYAKHEIGKKYLGQMIRYIEGYKPAC